MSSRSQQIGQWGERVAARYLGKKGYQIIDRHFQTHDGEIDLVALDAQTVVFVEVKTRRTQTFGAAAEAITANKLARLTKTIHGYLQRYPSIINQPTRIDIITIEYHQRTRNASLIHLKNAVDNCPE